MSTFEISDVEGCYRLDETLAALQSFSLEEALDKIEAAGPKDEIGWHPLIRNVWDECFSATHFISDDEDVWMIGGRGCENCKLEGSPSVFAHIE